MSLETCITKTAAEEFSKLIICLNYVWIRNVKITQYRLLFCDHLIKNWFEKVSQLLIDLRSVKNLRSTSSRKDGTWILKVCLEIVNLYNPGEKHFIKGHSWGSQQTKPSVKTNKLRLYFVNSLYGS